MMKMTKKEMFSVITSILEGKVVVADMIQEDKDFLLEKIAHEVELLDKKSKSGGSKNLTKTQKENADIKQALVEYLKEVGEPMRVGEIVKEEQFAKYSPSKITALLGQLISTDKKPLEDAPLIRTEVKKVAYYSAKVE